MDTQVIIWMEEDDSKISDHAKTKILSEPDLLIAQSLVEEIALVSSDTAFDTYNIQKIW